ncbi:hypothetical protein QBL02_01240 [Leucobacter sp. UT-8R-CII-1-4]|uniref:DUF7507 domain-containing protein n=1 Tax=Leucobacter sp. UT-8R-CII-1-4 TaxID=3040075 RepID=UPI0024A8F86E|nr:hypothetical protein [Leucobacter sp. UT-8R-CII-1-4]MDI6022163.1 hypothetical protein [Leucobacter sp. UT-8R-CII-1-4]
MTTPALKAARRPLIVGGAALALLLPIALPGIAQAAPAQDADTTLITSGGSFTQVVPDGVCAVNVWVAGAPGGLAISDGDAEPDPEDPGELRGANGAGGTLSAKLQLGAGSLIHGTVGFAGTNSGVGGHPGPGGNGGTGGHNGGGGGGYSSISVNGERLLLAAGGGGTGGGHTSDGGAGGDGGAGVYPAISVADGLVFPGGDGATGFDTGWNTDPATFPGGGIGGSDEGGAGGTNPRSNTDPDVALWNWNGFKGTDFAGGNGGNDNSPDTGGGGGAGYFGGGGGASTDGAVGGAAQYFVGGGGGGGSSFVSSSIDQDTFSIAKNRDEDGKAHAAYISFEWVMCDYNLEITKSVVGAVDEDGELVRSTPVFEDGDTVRYAVTVTNSGADAMAIGDTVTLVDDLAVGGKVVSVDGLDTTVPAIGGTIAAAGIEVFDTVEISDANDNPIERPRGLAVGQSVTVVYDTVVRGTDPVTNTVSTADRNGSHEADAIVAPAAPSLGLLKTADTKTVTHVGQVVKYSFLVTNTGNIELRDISIAEQSFSGKGKLSAAVCPDEIVQPGDSVTCTAEYTAVAGDLTGTPLTNTATASAATRGGMDVDSEKSAVEITTVKPAVLSNTGSATPMGLAAAAALLVAIGAPLAAATIRRNRARA